MQAIKEYGEISIYDFFKYKIPIIVKNKKKLMKYRSKCASVTITIKKNPAVTRQSNSKLSLFLINSIIVFFFSIKHLITDDTVTVTMIVKDRDIK